MTENISKEALLEKRDELLKRIQEIENDYRRGLDADSEERAMQLENADVLEGIAKSLAEELAEVEKKLEQLS